MFVISILVTALFTTFSAAAAQLRTNSSLSFKVTAEEGRDVILRYAFDGDVGPGDRVRWEFSPKIVHPTWRMIFLQNPSLNKTVIGYQVNRTLPGQFDLVVKNVNWSAAGWYKVTRGDQLLAQAELRVASLGCGAILAGDTTTLVCSLEFTDSGRDHPEVQWPVWSTYCATENQTNGTSSGGRRIRTASCGVESNRVLEINRTCVVRFTDATVGDNSAGMSSDRSAELSLKCSVDFPVGCVRSTTPSADGGVLPAERHQAVSAGERAVSSSGLEYYLLFGFFAFVRHLDSLV